MVNDDNHDGICQTLGDWALLGCLVGGVDGVVDDDSLMACVVDFLSDSCHDPVCDALTSVDSFLTCP